MPPKTRKRGPSADEELSPKGPAPTTKTTRASSVQKPARTTKAQQERNVTTQRNGRNSVEAMLESRGSKKLRVTLPDAKQEVRRMGDELIQLINDLDITGHDHTSTPEYMESKIASVIDDPQLSDSISRNQHQTKVYEKANAYIQVCQRTIVDYESLNKGDGNMQNPPIALRWEQDSKDLDELNRKAMAISLRTLNGVVLGGVYAKSLHPPASFEDDIEQVAWELLEEGRSAEGETWGAAARKMMEAFSGIVRLLKEQS